MAEMQNHEEVSNNAACRKYQESVGEWYNEQCTWAFNSWGQDGQPIRSLSVQNISKQTKRQDLEELFLQYGEIQQCEMKFNQNSLEGLVTFTSAEDALKARTDGARMRLVLDRRILHIFPANPMIQSTEIENCTSVRLTCPITESMGNEVCTRIDMLNDDCLIMIFLYLPIVDRIRLERVCKRWRAVGQASWSYVRKLNFLQPRWGLSYQSKRIIVDGEVLRDLLGRCGSRLKEIHFAPIFKDEYCNALSDVAEFCPSVQVINASLIPVSTVSIELLSRKCLDIRRLCLDTVDGPCDLELTKLFQQSSKLTHFAGCLYLDGDCLLHLPPSTIRELAFTDCSSLDFNHLAQALRKLENLSMFLLESGSPCHFYEIPLEVMEALSGHRKHLKRLDLPTCNFMVSNNRKLMELTNLEVLVLQGTDINDDFLIELSGKCQELTHLDISACSDVTWAGVAALASLPKLAKLTMIESLFDVQKFTHYWLKRGLSVEQLPHASDFSSLKHLVCRIPSVLSPSEMCCLIEHSPLLELVDLACDDCGPTLEEFLDHALARNSKVTYFAHRKPIP